MHCLGQKSTDLTGLPAALATVATAHNITPSQAMYAYVLAHNITVLSSYDPSHPDWLEEDLAIFNFTLSSAEVHALDQVTPGKRTCPDCYTFECQACAQALIKLGCPVGELHGGFVWGRSNPHGEECMACAGSAANKATVKAACGDAVSRGETLETLVPKACGI